MNDGKLRSNCIVEALREFRRRVAVWRKNPQQHEPYLLMRPSRHPGGVVHVLVGELDPKTDTVKVESFKPIKPVKHPWWRPPVRFEGVWVTGDTKPIDLDTVPVELDDKPR